MSNQKKISTADSASLPPIPEKIYFTIGEVSRLCLLKPHVLRYWEQEFTELSPVKRRGNRRYYQHKDVLLVRKIRHLLYEDGYTIEGARHQLADDGSHEVSVAGTTKNLKTAIKELEKVAAQLRQL